MPHDSLKEGRFMSVRELSHASSSPASSSSSSFSFFSFLGLSIDALACFRLLLVLSTPFSL